MNEALARIFVAPALRKVACPFRDRADAARFLSEIVPLRAFGEPVVVAATLGALELAESLASLADASIEFFPALPLSPSWSQALVYGAVAFDGSVVLDQHLIEEAGLTAQDVRSAIRAQTPRFRELFVRVMEISSQSDLHGRAVVLVDDGGASAAVLRATVAAIRNAHAAKVVFATAGASAQILRRLAQEVEKVYCASERGPSSERVFEVDRRAPMRTLPSGRSPRRESARATALH